MKRRAAGMNAVRVSGRVRVAGAKYFVPGLEDEMVRQVRLFLDWWLK